MKDVDEHSTDMCASCDTDLATCNTIWAAQGSLYCSRACGIYDFKYIHGTNAIHVFDSVSDEVKPLDIGIMPRCEWCGQPDSEAVHTDLGMLCPSCIRAIRSRGEQVEEDE